MRWARERHETNAENAAGHQEDVTGSIHRLVEALGSDQPIVVETVQVTSEPRLSPARRLG
ncbi:hypothetical protein [Micrococcus sp. IITD107]|uniref:hypothetical protein n=1 Tax=Micrococcus sp. IITD107 TaxID=3342790 RepID=UPI0035BB699F